MTSSHLHIAASAHSWLNSCLNLLLINLSFPVIPKKSSSLALAISQSVTTVLAGNFLLEPPMRKLQEGRRLLDRNVSSQKVGVKASAWYICNSYIRQPASANSLAEKRMRINVGTGDELLP